MIEYVWIFDINSRVYRRDENGKSFGSPIWRNHWRKCEVIGETSRSWVLRGGRKVSKKGGSGISFSEEEIDKLTYIHDNRIKISDMVRSLDDYNKMKEIASIVGLI